MDLSIEKCPHHPTFDANSVCVEITCKNKGFICSACSYEHQQHHRIDINNLESRRILELSEDIQETMNKLRKNTLNNIKSLKSVIRALEACLHTMCDGLLQHFNMMLEGNMEEYNQQYCSFFKDSEKQQTWFTAKMEKIQELTQYHQKNLKKYSQSLLQTISQPFVDRLNYSSRNLADNNLSKMLPKMLPRVTDLWIGNNSIGQNGMEHIVRKLPNLTRLHMPDNKIDDKAAMAITSLSKLKSLILYNNQVGQLGAIALSSLKQLEYLSICNNQVGSNGVTALSTLPNIEYLWIYNNGITDKGAISLTNLKKLKILWMEDNCVAEGTIKILKKSLPNCIIYG